MPTILALALNNQIFVKLYNESIKVVKGLNIKWENILTHIIFAVLPKADSEQLF